MTTEQDRTQTGAAGPESEPQWRKDFPVRWSEDHYVARREFTKFLVLGSMGLTVGNAWLWGKSLFERSPVAAREAVATAAEVSVGGVKLFRYPTAVDPCILIRLGEQQWVAYTQKCTHLSCAVHYDKARKEIVCPCHYGFFDPVTGEPKAGPPPRPLPRIELEIAGDLIYAKGVTLG